MVWPWPLNQHGYGVAAEVQAWERVHPRPRFRTPMHVEVFIQVGIAAAWRPLNPYFRQVRARYRPLITGLRLDGRDLPRKGLGGKKGLPSLKYAMAAARGRYVLMGFNGWPLGDHWALGSQGRR